MNLEITQEDAKRLNWILADKEQEYTTKLIRSARSNGTLEQLADWQETEVRIRTISKTREELIRNILGEEVYALIKSER